MLNQSIEYCQNRKKPAKKAMNSHECAMRRRSFLVRLGRPAGSSIGSDNAIAMEDFLNIAEVIGEAPALLDLEVARPGQIDIEDAVDAAGARGDDADPGRKLNRLLDRMGDEDDRRLALEPQALEIVADRL